MEAAALDKTSLLTNLAPFFSYATASQGPLKSLQQKLSPEWWKTLFRDEIYLLTDGDVVEDDSLTKEEVDLIVNDWIDVSKTDGVILDVCCGQGRHSIELARRGYQHVIGLDFSQYLIGLAVERAEKEKLSESVKFLQGDARKLPLESASVDLVICMGNSFGYFANEEDDSKVLLEMRRVLKPDGRLFLDISDGTFLLNNYSKKSWEWIDPEHFVCRERELDGTRLVSREVVTHTVKGIIRDQIYAERLYSQEAIANLLHNNLFSEVYSLDRYWTDSQRPKGDLGMMENRQMLVASAAPIAKLIAKLNESGRISPNPMSVHEDEDIHERLVDLIVEPVKGKEVWVVLPDPNLTDAVKPGGGFSQEDIETVEKLKTALTDYECEFYFSYLDDHSSIIDDLKQLSDQPCLILNFCDTGYWNNPSFELHVPALCDLFNLKYSGSCPRTLSICYDKSLVLSLAKKIGVGIPGGYETDLETLSKERSKIDYPIIVKPNSADGGFGITARSVCYDDESLDIAIESIKTSFKYDGTVLVEEFLEGADLTVGLIEEGDNLRVLPITEDDYSCLPENLPPIAGYESKWLPNTPYWKVKAVRAEINPVAAEKIKAGSALLFRRLELHDYARFDWRLDKNGEPHLLEVNPNPGWCWDGHLAKGASMDGISYPELLGIIIRSAIKRHGLWDFEVVPPMVDEIVRDMENML